MKVRRGAGWCPVAVIQRRTYAMAPIEHSPYADFLSNPVLFEPSPGKGTPTTAGLRRQLTEDMDAAIKAADTLRQSATALALHVDNQTDSLGGLHDQIAALEDENNTLRSGVLAYDEALALVHKVHDECDFMARARYDEMEKDRDSWRRQTHELRDTPMVAAYVARGKHIARLERKLGRMRRTNARQHRMLSGVRRVAQPWSLPPIRNDHAPYGTVVITGTGDLLRSVKPAS